MSFISAKDLHELREAAKCARGKSPSSLRSSAPWKPPSSRSRPGNELLFLWIFLRKKSVWEGWSTKKEVKEIGQKTSTTSTLQLLNILTSDGPLMDYGPIIPKRLRWQSGLVPSLRFEQCIHIRPPHPNDNKAKLGNHLKHNTQRICAALL